MPFKNVDLQHFVLLRRGHEDLGYWRYLSDLAKHFLVFSPYCRSCSSAQTLWGKKKKSVSSVIDWSTFLHRLTPIVLSLSSKIRSRLSFSTRCFLRRQAKATRSDCSMVLGIASRPNTHSQHGGLRSKHSGNQDDDWQQFPASRSSAEVTWAASVDFCPRVIVLPRQRKTGQFLTTRFTSHLGTVISQNPTLKFRLWFDTPLSDLLNARWSHGLVPNSTRMQPEWFNLLKGEKSNWSLKAKKCISISKET